MSDLFDASKTQKEPLAARLRPRNLDEYIGQDHIVGKGRLLRRAIAADQLTSVIFYGPPGCGKTTLARVIANHTKSNFITLNAVLTGVAEIRSAIKQADDYFKLYGKRTILFVDEVHRWNKAQQDALLPWVENGTIILIGATTENPFFEVNKALVSRSRVFQLKPLTKEDLFKAANFALNEVERGYGHWNVEFEKGALEHLVDTANGDARSLLNALELAVETTPEKWDPYNANPVPAWGSTIFISKETAEESIQKKVVLYDRDGDYHYDIISAFIKSLRGRDPDAAMYWLARMVRAGEDPHFIFRRMLISACEDTGLADPNAVCIVENCAQAFDRVGLPEGRYFLAHAALYLSTCPKSNSSMAFFDALSSVEKEDAEVPNHLRDSSRDAEGFGHGNGYLYPHAYRDHWVAQQYLPSELVGRVFYTPTSQGYEAKIKEDVLSRREIQISAILEGIEPEKPESDVSCGMHPLPHFATDFDNPIGEWWINKNFDKNSTTKPENLTFTPKNERRETALDRADKSWKSRLDSNRAEILTTIRNAMIQLADLSRHTRSLVWNADDGLLIWEVSRKTPEGVTAGLCSNLRGLEILEQYGRTLDDLDRPVLKLRPESLENYLSMQVFAKILEEYNENGMIFDRIFFRDPFNCQDSVDVLASALKNLPKNLVADGQQIVISQRIPSKGQKIWELIYNQVLTESTRNAYEVILKKMENAEKEFFGNEENPLFDWNENSVKTAFEEQGFCVKSATKVITEKRRITETEINRWFDAENSSYGSAMAREIGTEDLAKIKNLLTAACQNTLFNWNTTIEFLTVKIQADTTQKKGL
ncbi:putative ATPase [Treponema berlinense]|uniref:Replication-associated recombination protein A n=1 Tax=Treponema berlinense TaxID=225004 RepID=A0A1T4PR88_9SPIR|nr:AAA family ATPase [Treponema berlinense]SJZ93727.1 putative ATPase [Treponema berlinense]